ncbi:MAG: ArsR family transcriptional regulator [Acidimicrobiia bacterium]|nr:ArsR family transcriptional regulator [Acidimicrobiia bacterium]
MEEVSAPTLSTLAPTRREILEALKKRGELTADDLAEQLQLTTSGVRQHLVALTSDGLVAHRQVREGPGRPRHCYHLTPAADALFPRAYSDLTNELLGYASDDDPELVERLFERRRKRRVQDARNRLKGKDFEGKVDELARILDEDGYLADFRPMPEGQGFLITEHNCAILGVARRYGQACSSEIGFLREALPEAKIERVQHMIAGAHSCAYEVKPRSPNKRRKRS